jgi:hypothetical protein
MSEEISKKVGLKDSPLKSALGSKMNLNSSKGNLSFGASKFGSKGNLFAAKRGMMSSIYALSKKSKANLTEPVNAIIYENTYKLKPDVK